MLSFNRLHYGLLFIFIIFLNLQNLSLNGWIDENNEGSILKVYHLISLAFLFLIAIKINRKACFPPYVIVLFHMVVLISSLWALTIFPFNSVLINYIFSFYCFCIGYYSVKVLGNQKCDKILELIAIAMMIAVTIKGFISYDKIMTFFENPFGHPVMLWFYGGGANLEATWIAMMSVFFIKRKSFYYYILGALVISFAYASRTGLMLCLISLIFKLLAHTTSKKEKIVMCCGLSFALGVAIYVIIQLDIDIFLVNRFMAIGEDPGSIGRLELWEYVAGAAKDNLWGYGAGNAVNAVALYANRKFDNDNLHNYYGQVLLDFGVLGLLSYLLIVARVIVNEVKCRLNNPKGLFLILYFCGSILQFRGAEAFVWLIFGFYFYELYEIAFHKNGQFLCQQTL